MDTDPARPVAAASLTGRTLRYAEVAGGPGGPRLRRLGAADFDVDAEAAVYGPDGAPDPGALDAIAEALAQAFAGTAAATLRVVAPPTATTAFFTPLPAGLAAEVRDGQLRQETALLADLAPTEVVRVVARHVRTEPAPGGAREWFHVVHVDEPVHARLAQLADALGLGGYEAVDSTRAAAAVAGSAGLDLVVGAFGTHTEVAVVERGAFLFGTHGPSTEPADTAYFALAALHQAGADPALLSRLLVYGDDATAARMALAAEFVEREPEPLDPFAPFGHRPDADDAELAAFGPVLGAAL